MPSSQKELRRKLRKNATPFEKLFWYQVRNRQFNNLKFRRQHTIGNYIVDFYCAELKLIIEVDGDSHSRFQTIIYDTVRSEYFVSLGYTIIRYQNRDIRNNIQGVLYNLTNQLGINPPLTPP